MSHPHEDHHKGFEEAFFNDIKIEHIWLSPAFDRENPQAKGFYALQDAAARALNALNSLSETALGEMKDEVRRTAQPFKKRSAGDAEQHPAGSSTASNRCMSQPTRPKNSLKIFEDPAIKLKVLGPMGDIDRYYLGGNGLMNTTERAQPPQPWQAGYEAIFIDPSAVEVKPPQNISAQDFKLLRGRIQANALAAAAVVGHAVNNLSVVLLLEWHGRRLLFSGDAEWSEARNGAVQAGSSNGSWNVMWQERKADLSQPLDFYKIGHHGSENATPWTPGSETGKNIRSTKSWINCCPNRAGETPQAYAVASTQRTARWPSIPNAALLEEIGKRVANSRTEYVEEEGPKSVKPHVAQPQRTDLEEQVTQAPVPFIELKFPPDIEQRIVYPDDDFHSE